MDRTLILTSPLMKGEDVKRAQYVLNRHNELDQDFYTGELDGAYGVLAAQAAYRAHYWLGFTLPDLSKFGHRYGTTLDNLLTGKTELDAKRKALRASRLKTVGQTPMRELAFKHMLTHLGAKESPAGSNRSYASAWYGMVGAWCAMAVTEAYVLGGKSKAFVKGQRYAYVPYMEADARAGRNFLTITLNPQHGDVVCFDWDDDGVSDHTGLFDYWIDRPGGRFATLEGNTSPTSDSNGGEVMRRDRNLHDVSLSHNFKPAFIHVGH